MQLRTMMTTAACMAMAVSGSTIAASVEKTAIGVVGMPDTGDITEVRREVMSDTTTHMLKRSHTRKARPPHCIKAAKPSDSK